MSKATDKEKLETYRKAVAILVKQKDELQIVLAATNELLQYYLNKQDKPHK
jgi:hypothetical protein